MILPAPRLMKLLAWGSPLWFLTLFWWGLALVPLTWLVGCLGLAIREARDRPGQEALAISREIPARLAYREKARVKLSISNQGDQTLWMMVRDEAPDPLGAEDQVFSCELPPGRTITVHYPVTPQERGVFSFGRVVLRTSWARNLVQTDWKIPVETTARVYPRFRGSSNYELLARIAQREEARRPRRQRGHGSDYESLQPYVAGHDPRTIEWKSSARRGTLICRRPQVERGQHLALLVDSGRLMAGQVEHQSRLEHVLEAAVRLSYVVQKRGDTLSVSVFSNKVESFVPRLKKSAIMPAVLETFCSVEQRTVESDYWRVTAQVLSKLRQRSLVVMFTHILDAAGSKGLLRNLRRAANRHLVLCVILSEPALVEASLGKAETAEQAWRVGAACDLLRRRRLALEQMKAYGILVLECAPQQLNNQLIQRYLEIRRENLQ